jgi:hypothetical protein
LACLVAIAVGCPVATAAGVSKRKTTTRYCSLSRASSRHGRHHNGHSVDAVVSRKRGKPKRMSSASPCAAKTLTRALAAAKTQKQRIAAITSIAGSSALGVYQADGRRVVGGAEAGPHDLYLYTFMIKSLADQLARGSADYSSFDEEAAALNALHVTLNGAGVTGPALEAAVAGGLRRLPAASSNPVDQLGLVIRDLGARRHIDWSRPPASSARILDPLQRYLILVDITRPLIHAAAVKSSAEPGAAADAMAHQAACDGNFSGGLAGAGIAGRTALGVWKTGPGLILQLVLDGVEGTAFAYSFKVTALNPHGNSGAFGTHGPQSATPLDFKVKTEMLDDLSSTVINCGSLVGYTVPGKGPLSGTTINWDQSQLPDFGTVTCQASCTTTDSDGIATLRWQPYDEYLPGQGPKITTIDTITASAFPSKSNGNILGAILEALGINKFAVFAYSVSYHDPGGYKVQIPAITSSGTESLDGTGYDFTDHFVGEESCDLGASRELGLKGNPLKPQPYLGLSPSPSPASSYAEDETAHYPGLDPVFTPGASAGAPASWQMGGLDYPAPSIQTDFGRNDLDNGGSIGGLQMSGTWVFDASGLHAVITAARQGVSPGSVTYNLPVTRATDCH